MKGLLITLEGGEGAGKSTQIKLLAAHLSSQGREVVVTREPGGTRLAECIRDLLMERREEDIAPLAELLLYEAARAQHAAQVIIPALERGAIVLCDRYADSTAAYQGAGRQLDNAVINQMNRLAAGRAWPDHTFLIDLPPEAGLQRARDRGSEDRMMAEALPFHQRIRDYFLRIAQDEPDRITIVDGSQAIETIQEQLRAAMAALLTTVAGKEHA